MLVVFLTSCESDKPNIDVPVIERNDTIRFSVTAEDNHLVDIYAKGSNLFIDWGDTEISTDENMNFIANHVYKKAGVYDVKIATTNLTHLYLKSLAYNIIMGDCPKLDSVSISYNKLVTKMNIRSCPKLSYFSIYDLENLESVELIGCPQLKELSIAVAEKLSFLNIRQNRELRSLELYMTGIPNINLSNNPLLEVLDCTQSPLKILKATNNPALKKVLCADNELSEIDLSSAVGLTNLVLKNNQLANLDVSQLVNLTHLDCRSNKLTALNVSYNTSLLELKCANNELTDLDVSKNTVLNVLYCYSNQLQAETLDKIFTELPPAISTPSFSDYNIGFWNNPGSATCTPSIITDKEWAIRTSDTYANR
ncbi:MAG: hypothetical protein RL662_1010 [Bacteroidota bacterium]